MAYRVPMLPILFFPRYRDGMPLDPEELMGDRLTAAVKAFAVHPSRACQAPTEEQLHLVEAYLDYCVRSSWWEDVKTLQGKALLSRVNHISTDLRTWLFDADAWLARGWLGGQWLG